MSSLLFVSPSEEGPSVHDLHGTISVSSCPSLWMSSLLFVSPGEEGPSVHDLHVVPSPSRVVLPDG